MLMHARRVLGIAIATLCIHGLAFTQSGRTTLHDFDGVGDLSSLRTDGASFELVGGRADRGRALRISFDEAQGAERSLVFEKSSLPRRDFSQIGGFGFWVKIEGDSGAQIQISLADLDGKRGSTDPHRAYIYAGKWQHIVYRPGLDGLDRKRIGSIRLFLEHNRTGRSFLVDDFELYSPLVGRLVAYEDQVRRSLDNLQAKARQIDLETFIEADTERLMQRLRNAVSLADSERFPVLYELVREASNLARTIGLGGKNLTLRGRRVTDAWLAACAPKIANVEIVELAGTSITDAGLAHLCSFKHLDRLLLRSPGITGSGLKGFTSTQLSELFLQDSGVNDAGLESIAAFRIGSIYLGHTGVTDAGLRHLAGMESLTTLSLRGTAITNEGLSHLRNLTALESLYLGSTDITSLADLGELKNLKHLDLRETRVDDAAVARLEASPRLETLNLAKTDLLGPGLAGLEDAKRLSILKLNGTRINDAGIVALGEPPMLSRLEVSSTRITDAALVRIARSKRLRYLDIYGTNVTGDGVRHLGALTGLTELYAGGTGADDASIAALVGLQRLRNLDLRGTRVTDASLESIGKLKKLSSLNLSGTAVKGSTISKLSGIEALGGLYLEGTAISNDALDSITRLASLGGLVLTDTDVSDEGLENISRLKGLRGLHLEGTKVSDKSLERVGLIPGLQDLRLDGTAVSDDGLAALANSRTLAILSLKRTGITDEALTRIGNPIQELALSHTRVSDAGVRTLANKRGLGVLELAGTAVTDGVLEEIAQLPNLRVLDLSATPISDRGVAVLKTLPALHELRLDRTAITDQAAESLVTFASLGEVSLEGTRVTADGRALLRRRRPNLAVELDFPWGPTSWSKSALPEDVTVADLGRLSAVRSLSLQHRTVDGATVTALRDLENLESLDLADTSVDDDLLASLSGLSRLRVLRLSRTEISDDALRHLAGLQALEHLDLDGTRVTGAGLRHLAGLTALRSVCLRESLLGDEHIAELAALGSLRKISLTNTRLGDAGLRELERLPALRYLDLFGTDVTDAGLESIGRMSSLSHLYLSRTAVTDAGLAALVGLEELVELGVDGCEITDHGLEHLLGFRHLERLRLDRLRVSDAGIEAFKERRPDVVLTFVSEPSKTFSWIGIALAVLYGLIALAICLYGAHRYLLVWLFVRRRGVRSPQAPASEFPELPRVTIQIPLFNERNVAERIIAAACAMDYPSDRLQIQVLDDSTDDCTEIARACCERFQAKGVDVVCHHRYARDGFKSGALAAGLETATGELVAIFDADFVPAPDFLQRTVHHFTDEKVGVVQAEWRHLNRDESTLTQCQAMFLDGHFLVEQATRARTGRWFNFNGTAGLWRRPCIDLSGGWGHDTLTEDTDLSYRAQLAGWRFVYLPDVHVDAELPSTMSAFISQQHRWTRGLLQCAVKLMPRILFSKAPLRVKAEAWFHLTTPILYAVMFVLAALAVPATFVIVPLSQLRGAPAWALGGAVLLGGTLAAAVFILIAQRAAGQSLWRTLARLPALMALGVGMSAVNTRAALGALLGRRSPFVRTPKFGGRSDSEADPGARRGLTVPPGSVELVISGVLFACLVLSLGNDFALIGTPFLLLFASGFLWVGGARLVESGPCVTVSTAVRFRALRWSGAAAVVVVTVGIVLGTNAIARPPETGLVSRVAGVELTHAHWKVRGSSIASAVARLGGLTLDVDLDPKLGAREEGEIFIDLTGPLAPLGASLSDSRELVFDITYPRSFSGELQAFVSDAEGRSQYGSIAFVERHDALRRVRVGIAPGPLTPAMGYTDPDFEAQPSIRRVGLKVSAQSDRVRGRGYRPFRGELTVADVRVVPRSNETPPEIRAVPADSIHRPQPASREEFLASSGADRPWPLGYAFSGALSAEQRTTLDQTYAALQRRGLGFTRVYLGDYRTGLVVDAAGSVTGVEPEFLGFLDGLAQIANRHGVTVMFSLMDNTVLDGKGVEFPQFVVDREESDRFVTRVLAPIVEKLAERQVIWDLFNEPENVTGAALSEVQGFVDRALTVLRRSDADAKFTVVSRSASELVYWRGRGLDVLSHNIFDQRGLDSAVKLAATTDLDAPVWIAEMDPELATVKSLEALRHAGYRGVGLWGWGTGDKYDWSADELERVVSPLLTATEAQRP